MPLFLKYKEVADATHLTPAFRLSLAMAYMNAGQSKEARAELAELISSDSNTYEARKAQFLIAYDSINSGNMAAGKQELETLMTRYPNSDEAKQAKDLHARLSSVPAPK